MTPSPSPPSPAPGAGAEPNTGSSAGRPPFYLSHLPLPSKGERPGTGHSTQAPSPKSRPSPGLPSTHPQSPRLPLPAGNTRNSGTGRIAPAGSISTTVLGGPGRAPSSRHGHRAPGPGISQPGNRPPRQEREASQTAGEDEISPRAPSGAACKKTSCAMAVTRGGLLPDAHTSGGTVGDHTALPHHHHHQRRG